MYDQHYSDDSLWAKIKGCVKSAGEEVLRLVLRLYYVLDKPDLPVWAKTAIYGALGYFIFPIDAIPDITPIVGYTDDLGVLTAAVATVATYIDDEVKEKADRKLREWFA